jgi:hypothetical protein
LNGNLVGNIDYKNPQIGIEVNKGNNILLVQNKTFEKKLNLKITNEKIIFPIEIAENWTTINSKTKTSKLIQGFFNCLYCNNYISDSY